MPSKFGDLLIMQRVVQEQARKLFK